MKNYFKPSESMCSCGCGLDIEPELRIVLNRARSIAGIPFIINSGARCKEHNTNIGGRYNSAHIKGLAVDIKADNNESRAIIHNALCKVGFQRFGIYDRFIHTDIDLTKPHPRLWID